MDWAVFCFTTKTQEIVMALFDWNDEYSVGVYQMDNDHKKLFSIVNKLHEAMKDGIAEAAVAGIIKELLDYTRFHFEEEEKLMEGINYPGLSAQKSAHKMLISKIEEFKQEAANGMAIFVASKLVNTAVDWLKNHILVLDKRYQEEMTSKGIK